MSAGGTRTVDYIARRTAEGKSQREFIRCLKRFVAREVFKLIEESAASGVTARNRLRQRRRTLAIPISTVATAHGLYQRVRRREIGHRLDPDLVATYSRWLTDPRAVVQHLSLADIGASIAWDATFSGSRFSQPCVRSGGGVGTLVHELHGGRTGLPKGNAGNSSRV